MTKKQKMSKMAIDEKEIKAKTIPNPAVSGGIEEIGLKRINPIEIPKYLLMHPALSRGIEMKANRMIKLVDDDLENNILPNKNKKSDEKIKNELVEYCKGILFNSGGPLFLKKLTQGAFRFGTSFAHLQQNVAGNKVLRFEYQHPIFFGPAKYPKVLKGAGVDWGDILMLDRSHLIGKMKIDPRTKEISMYTQYTKKYPSRSEDNWKFGSSEYINTRTHPEMKENSPGELIPVGEEISKSEVIQLAFDTIGDEPLGISLVQYLHLTIQYLLNMERAGAQTMVNFGFNKWKANTPFKDFKKMQEFAKTLSNIQKDSVVVLPDGITLENIVPGTTEFDSIHPIYMRLIAIRLGIPMPLLSQDGTSTNKATIQEMRKDMYEDFIADELTIERTINDGFFKACQIKYPDKTIEELNSIVPKFKFKQPPEDIDTERERDLKFTLAIRNLSIAAQTFFEIGNSKVTTMISNKVNNLIKRSMDLDYFDESETNEIAPNKNLNKRPTDKKEEEKDIDEQIEEINKDKDE